MFFDVKKVRLNGRVPDDEFACVKLPDGKMRLKRWLCGMKPAAPAWEEEYASKIVGIGFARGSNSAVFRTTKHWLSGAQCTEMLSVFLCCGAHAGELVDKMSQLV